MRILIEFTSNSCMVVKYSETTYRKQGPEEITTNT